MHDEDTRTGDAREINAGTLGITLHRAPHVAGPPLGPRDAFLIAHERLSVLTRVTRGPSFAVVAVDANAQVVASLLVADRRALIAGRHTQCGLRLVDDGISLRQIAALVRFEDRRPVIHLRDLATDRPFVTEDGQRSVAVVAEGPLYAAVEGYAFWFVPSTGGGAPLPERAEAAYASLPERRFIDRREPGAAHAARPAFDARPRGPFDSPITSVTQIGSPLLLGDGDEPEVSWGVLRLSDGRRREKRSISAERLERGILLGRYSRCGLLIETPENTVSRVHAMLLRIGTEVWLLDTASTNGTRRGDATVTAEVLADADSLVLANQVTLDWRKTVHADA